MSATTTPHDTAQSVKAPENGDFALRAIIVEDEHEFIVLAEEAIFNLSPRCSIWAFTSGKEAKRFIESHEQEIHIALVDLGLPDISGLDVIKSIKSRYPKTPVLIFSCYSTPEIFFEGLRSGANGYTLKNEDRNEIVQAAKHAISGNWPISPALTKFLIEGHIESSQEENRLAKILSRRELDLLKNISKGLTFQQCAHEMGLQVSTVHAYSKTLYRKIGVKSKSQAALKASEAGLNTTFRKDNHKAA